MKESRVLALISQDPILKEVCGRINERRDQLEQQLEFIRKQQENAINSMRTANEPDWEILTARLKDTGALETYNKDTHHLSFSVETNAIELVSNKRHRHPLEALFGGQIEIED